MLDVIVGSQSNPAAEQVLREVFERANFNGTLYLGYPILASPEGPVSVDGLLSTDESGIIVFDFKPFDSMEEVAARQDRIHAAVFQKLYSASGLRRGRQNLAVDIRVVTVSPGTDEYRREGDVLISSADRLLDVIGEGAALEEGILELINASIERVSSLKSQPKRIHVTRRDSRGAIIEQIEREIVNLDRWQKKAAIETPSGPQRIRGLAGSGKTIVLALKAAYLHAQHPDWHIALTFHTRSLYQQLRDLVMRFSFEATNDEPNWDRLRILHTWGSSRQSGVYSLLASSADQPVRDFNYGRSKYGYERAFEGVCAELLAAFEAEEPPPLFDVVLIDEAQDLPKEFIQLCYLGTRRPHRVVWAYDELQNLTQESFPPLAELFGVDDTNQPRVDHLRTEGSPREDIILPVCYRNPPWTLTMAHALGFGIYREKGLAQFFDDANLWEEVGYEVVRGGMVPGSHVTLRRSASSYPAYFDRLLDREESIKTKVFRNREEQATWVATEIAHNLTADELRPQDILVVLSNPLTQKRDASQLMKALGEFNLSTHLAGVTSSVDELFQEDSIALSAIFRAKGNEAAMVYVLNGEYGASGLELIKRRNVLFTAITRSRAWVRICGVGQEMEELEREVRAVIDHDYQLDFYIPTAQELERLRRIHRDMPAAEKSRISKTAQEFRDLLSRIESGELPTEVLSPELRQQFERITGTTE